MRSKLYSLALWYIEKCNVQWDKHKYENELKSLDRLTYWNFEKYMLAYGADAEWKKFSRYEVLNNAIQKLALYENEDNKLKQGIRADEGRWNRMSDLISRKDVLALFPTNDCSDKMVGLYERVLDIPTAYDVEKVVEQINGMEVVLSVDDISADNLKFTNKILRLVKDGAIERIRKGGVE